jgi:hypothetical protein
MNLGIQQQKLLKEEYGLLLSSCASVRKVPGMVGRYNFLISNFKQKAPSTAFKSSILFIFYRHYSTS